MTDLNNEMLVKSSGTIDILAKEVGISQETLEKIERLDILERLRSEGGSTIRTYNELFGEGAIKALIKKVAELKIDESKGIAHARQTLHIQSLARRILR